MNDSPIRRRIEFDVETWHALNQLALASGKRLQDLYICVLTAFHVAKPGEKLAEMQEAVGSYVTSECNIFALSVKDPNDLPADIRDDMMRFREGA